MPAHDIALGESIAVSGCCLTVVEFDASGWAADVSNETLALTTLGSLEEGSAVNLERSLLPTDRLGGHLVSGHVDAVGKVDKVWDDGRSQRWRFSAPASVLRYVAVKGSIAVDGTSLTVNAVDATGFEVNLSAAYRRPHRLRRNPGRRRHQSRGRHRRPLRRAPAGGSRGTAMSFAPVPELLEEIRQGRMVVIVDDEDRENEGDLIMAAELVKPSDINFMVTHARGLVCLSLTRERCAQLGLAPMVQTNTAQFQTNFTVSIEAAEGVTTGISAYDRAHTVRTAVRPDAKPSDLSQPGHIFPLTAQPGGVLTRAGHTEAASDLPMLAGLEPAGVLVEVMNADGSMARRPELEVFAREHGLKMGSIADLIAWRLATEHTVERIDEREIETEFGPFRLVTYRDRIAHELHFALVKGSPGREVPTLCACRWRIRSAICCIGDATILAWPVPMPCARSPAKGRA